MDGGRRISSSSVAAGRPRPRSLPVALWIGGMGLAVFDAAAAVSYGRPPLSVINVLVTPAVYYTTGLIAWRRQPASLVGPLLMAVPAVPMIALALRYVIPEGQAFQIGVNNGGLLIQAYLLLSFPASAPAGRAERAVMLISTIVFAIYVVATVVSLEPAMAAPALCPPCAPNPLRVFDAGVSAAVELASDLYFVIALAVIVGLVIRRWYRASPPMRRLLGPVVLGGLVMGGAVLVPEILERAAPGLVRLVSAGFSMVGILVPVGLLVSFLRLERARASLAGAVVSLGTEASMTGLTNALRESLHDPSLSVVQWSKASGAFLDQEGRRVELPPAGSTRGWIPLERGGDTVGAVVLDTAVAADPELVVAIAEAGRFALDAVAIRDELVTGSGNARSLPTGAVTFLFGDVEGSTEILGRLGDRYVDLLVELRGIIRSVAEQHRGHVVDARADECFLAFGQAEDALEAAAAIQRRLDVAAWPGGGSVQMRIGLHTGRPDLTDHGYVGLDVHLAARVMGAANGGQVLLSDEVADVARREGRPVTPLGRFRLRGIREGVDLVALSIPDLPDDPRPPRAEALSGA